MMPMELKPGMIMQLNPEKVRNPLFAACFLTVDEPKEWGCQGYVQGWGEDGQPGGQAHYRAQWEEMEPTGGMAVWELA